jgi:hypothetical protein
MKWKILCGMVLCFSLVCLSVSLGVCQQVDVKMDKAEYAQFRLNKIQVELNTINTELRKKNPAEFKRIDELIAQAQAIQAETQPAVPAKAPAKK